MKPWRPDNWECPFFTDTGKKAFESGANAMLKALRLKGKEEIWPVLHTVPRGILCDIPNDEEVIDQPG